MIDPAPKLVIDLEAEAPTFEPAQLDDDELQEWKTRVPRLVPLDEPSAAEQLAATVTAAVLAAVPDADPVAVKAAADAAIATPDIVARPL